MKVTVWMRVTDDKYELPVCIADTTTELARMCNTTPKSITSCIAHAKKDGRKSVYKKVTFVGRKNG